MLCPICFSCFSVSKNTLPEKTESLGKKTEAKEGSIKNCGASKMYGSNNLQNECSTTKQWQESPENRNFYNIYS